MNDGDGNFCPVLFSLGVFSNTQGWCVRLPTRDVHLQAPGDYLDLVQRWCDGRSSWVEVRQLARLHWCEKAAASVGSLSDFLSFMDALRADEVLVDAGHLLRYAKPLADNPNDWGRSVPPEQWPALRAPLRPLLPAHDTAQQLGGMGSSPAAGWAGMAQKRRSCYEFSHDSLTRADLLELLASYAVTCQAANAADGSPHRAVPSGGGLYRLGLTLAVLRPLGTGPPAGVWRVEYFQSGDIALHPLRGNDAAFCGAVYRACLAPHTLDGASAWLMLSADLATLAAKYRNRALGHAYLEAGAVMQNLALIAAQRNLGQLPVSAFDEERVTALFELSGQVPLISVVLGKPVRAPEGHGPVRRARWTQTLPGLPHHLAMAWPRHAGPDGPANVCFGRDLDPLRAYQKAMCEAVERDAMALAPLSVRWASLEDLQRQARHKGAVIDPRRVLSFAEAQYREEAFPLAPFDAKGVFPWVQMDGLTGQAKVWMLADFVGRRGAMTGAAFGPGAAGRPYAYVNSSGCAASPSRRHALQNALLELVERDAFMRFWMSRQGGTAMAAQDISALGAETFSLWQRLLEAGCRVALLRLETPWAQVVLSVVQHPGQHFTLCGAGAGWELADAGRKAMGEIATGALARLAGVQTRRIVPAQVRYPVDHLHLYCQPEYFRKADFLFDVLPGVQACGAQVRPTSMPSLLAALKAAGHDACVSWLAIEHLSRDHKNRPIEVARVVVAGLVPITFGASLMPLGMGVALHPDWDAFPHPFP